MKKILTTLGLGLGCMLLSGCTIIFDGPGAMTWILLVLSLLILAFAGLRLYSTAQYNKRRVRKQQRKVKDPLSICVLLAGLILLVCAFLTMYASAPSPTVPGATGEEPDPSDPVLSSTEASTEPSETAPPPPKFQPYKTLSSDPDNWQITWQIYEDDMPVEQYTAPESIHFGDPEGYFALPGISTFRGNNYRNSATYGTAQVTGERLLTHWTAQTSTLPGATWSGSGWTGQPLIVQWDAKTRQNMNLYEDKKAKEDLVEVIYATLDGHIYFLDLQTGEATRDPINVGLCFKGAGSLDPRGLPLMYVGSGDVNPSGERPRMYIISLIDGSILFEYGHNETISHRTDNDNWCAFDSAPLVHAETDTLIWPGESGILYTMKLNSSYDADAGTLSIDPGQMVKTTYTTGRSNSDTYWYGYEASVNIVENYLYVSENGGMFFCIDLNTMELVWAQDTCDDSNSSPVFERTADDQGYIYTAPSLHWTRDSNMQGVINIYKIDAVTGEFVWQRPYQVHTVDGVSGGVQSSPLLGKPGTDLEGLIIYTIARTPDAYTGYMVALNTETGEEVWRMDMNNYTWSSPVAFYTEEGKSYIVVCDSMGYAMLVDSTGALLYTAELGGLVEASPAVYGNMLVVGTRKERIVGLLIE